MSIVKSIIVTLLFFIIATLLDLSILFFDKNISLYRHVLGLWEILPDLATYLLFIAYLRVSKIDVSLKPTRASKNYWIIILLLMILAVGGRLFDLPFWEWKNLSNKYFGTTLRIESRSNYIFSVFHLYRFFAVMIIAPIFEETFFRYYIFGGLLKKYRLLTAILVSSALFALIHIDSPRNIIPTFVFGIISSIVYFRTRKLIYSILLHFFTNGIWLATVVFSKQYNDFLNGIGLDILFWLIFFIGIFLLLFGLKKITTANIAYVQLGRDE